MADRAKKITELALHTTPANSDLLVIVSNPSTTAATRSITLGNLSSFIVAGRDDISALPELLAPTADDVIAIQDDPSSPTGSIKKVLLGTLLGSLANTQSNNTFSDTSVVSMNNLIIRKKVTPANSTVAVAAGSIFYDDNYIYLAVSENNLRRVPLESF